MPETLNQVGTAATQEAKSLRSLLAEVFPDIGKLESLVAILPETVTLADVQHHPPLGRVLLVCDALSNRLEYAALEWLKRTG